MLIRAAAINAVLLLLVLVGLVVDPRLISGAPAWLKPAKFCLSAVMYLLTLAWMVFPLPNSKLLRRTTGLMAVLLTLEVLVICLQAARGTTSHFNVDSVLDATIFSAMGFGIATVWIGSAIVLSIHWSTALPDSAMAMAFRWGLLLNIAGSGVGWTMTRPFPGQIEAINRGERPRIVGSHTVGARDGGPGLPITRWSTTNGDLRVAHFIGMHAWQFLPLLLLGMRRVRAARDDTTERAILLVATGAYGVVVALALQQALAGRPVIPLPGS